VKSLTPANTPTQIRLGLGQVLDFAQRVRDSHPDLDVHPALIVESEPHRSGHWTAVCDSAGVTADLLAYEDRCRRLAMT
jgi:hypothetical protein